MEPSSPGFLYAPTISKSAFRALLDPKGIIMPPALAASAGINLDPACGRDSGSPGAAGLPEGWFNAAMLRPSLLTSPMPGWEQVRRAAEATAWEMKLRERQQSVVMEEDDKGTADQIRLSSNRNLGEAAAPAAAVRSIPDSAPLAKNADDDDHRTVYAARTGSGHAAGPRTSSSSWQQQQQREPDGATAPSTRGGLEIGVRHGAKPNGTSSDSHGLCPQQSRSSRDPTPQSQRQQGSERPPTRALTPPSALVRPSSLQFGGNDAGRRQHHGQEQKEEDEELRREQEQKKEKEELIRREEEELLERIRRCPASASLWIGESGCNDDTGRGPRRSLAGFTEPQFLLDAEFAASRLRQRSGGTTLLQHPMRSRGIPDHRHDNSFDHKPQ